MKSVSKILGGLSLVLVACAIPACGGSDETPAETGGGTPGAGGGARGGAAGATAGAGGATAGAGGATAGAGGTTGTGGAGGAMGGAAGTMGGAAGTIGGAAGTMGGAAGTMGGAAGTTGGAGGAAGAGGSTGCVQSGGLDACTESAAPASVAGDAGSNCPAALTGHGATALDRSCWSISASICAVGIQTWAPSGDPPVSAIDSVAGTRYSTGQAMNVAGHALIVDLKTAQWIDGVKVDHTTPTNPGADKMLAYEIDVSMDKTTWTPVACGTNAATIADIGFASTQARYVKIVQIQTTTAATITSWWSVSDLNVYRGAQPEGGIEAGTDGGTDALIDVSTDVVVSTDAPIDVSADAPEDVSVSPDAPITDDAAVEAGDETAVTDDAAPEGSADDGAVTDDAPETGTDGP
jgi:hypothetical protein